MSSKASFFALACTLAIAACSSRRAHIDATQLGPCSGCHGGALNAAPPRGLHGEDSTSALAVGAHQKHLADSPLRRAIACSECHVVPATVDAPGHIDDTNGIASVTFGPLATSGGASPQWNRSPATCASTYCHGNFLGGNAANAPVWTQVDATPNQAECGTCHDLPPAVTRSGAHPTVSIASGFGACSLCHPDTVKPDGTIDLDKGNHIDGTVEAVAGGHPAAVWVTTPQGGPHGIAAKGYDPAYPGGLAACQACHGQNLDGVGGTTTVSCNTCHPGWRTSCTFCHGDSTKTATATTPRYGAPPEDTHDQSSTTSVTVGAHQAHIGTSISDAVAAAAAACTTCHLVPTDALTPATHIDGPNATVTWGSLATIGGVFPAWNRNAATCASTYCHGNLPGGKNATPVWTSVGTSQAACGSCHALPPDTGQHVFHVVNAGKTCADCHGTGYSSGIDRALHVNGAKDVGNKITSYDPVTRSCTLTCHDNNNRTW